MSKTVIDVRCGVNRRLITNHLWPIRVVITFPDRFQATATLQVSLQWTFFKSFEYKNPKLYSLSDFKDLSKFYSIENIRHISAKMDLAFDEWTCDTTWAYMALLYIWIIPTSNRCIVNLYTVTSYSSVRLNTLCTSRIIYYFWRHKWCVHEFNILLRLYKYLKLVFWVTKRIIPKIWTCYFFAFLARDKYLDKNR